MVQSENPPFWKATHLPFGPIFNYQKEASLLRCHSPEKVEFVGGGAAEKPPCLQQDRPQDLLVDRFLDEKMALARVGDRSLPLRRDKTLFRLYIYT